MGHGLTKGDLIALTASGDAAKKLHSLLTGLREDAVSALTGNALDIYHKNAALGLEGPESNPAAADLASALTLVNSLRGKVVAHLASTGVEGTHLVASAAAIAAPVATNLATANTLANELKADYNTHRTETGVHLANDATNAVAAANAVDLATLLALVNEIKSDYNAHIASAMASPAISDQPT